MKKLALAAALVASVALPVSTSALIIDNFDDPTMSLSANSGTPSANNGNTAATGAIGGYRYVEINYVSGPLGIVGNVAPPPSSISFSAQSQTTGNYWIQYNGASGSGFSAVDLTIGGALGIYMNFLGNDLGASVVAYARSGANAGYFPLPSIGEGTVFFPFGSFITYAGTGADFSAITALAFQINGTENGDYTVDFIETRDKPPGVPDVGGTMLLLSMGLGLLGVARWKMNA